MKQDFFKIQGIPAIVWGEPASKLIIAVHGNMSHKSDVIIELMAEYAIKNGYQILSFDLPEHGDRKNQNIPCKVQYCVKELADIMAYAKTKWLDISLFANSMGAYFSLLTYYKEPLSHAWFLSPVVDMENLIENMMTWFGVSKEQLEAEQTVATPMGQNLYWDYYCYVRAHPVCKWDVSTHILYGSEDELCEFNTIEAFVKDFGSSLKIVQGSKHFFHTDQQLQAFKEWLDETL